MKVSCFLSLFLVFSLYGSDEYDSAKATGYIPEGKIPSGFHFKKCEERDEECKNRRNSFMSQYAHHERTKSVFFVNDNSVTITSDSAEDLIITQSENGDIHIFFKNQNK